MHSVSHSATPGVVRAGRREQTAHRITRAAQKLVLDRGIDAFTMDQLAEQVGVSRRTLFNYFPSKDDAILGGPPVIAQEDLDVFSGGGPSGHLVQDLAALVLALLRDNPEERAEVARARQVMHQNPRLIALAHQRLQEAVESCLVRVEQREGARFSRTQADVAVALVLVSFHLAMDRFLDDDEAHLADLFTETLDTARQLLA